MAKIAKTHEDIEAQILEIQGMKATLLEEGEKGVGLVSTGFFDQEIYGGEDSRFDGYVTSIAANEQEDDDEEDTSTSLLGQKKPGVPCTCGNTQCHSSVRRAIRPVRRASSTKDRRA
ncbi:unnamed protein product [Pleuronectes platessa]|uniref:Uncharacterized protein n=1 Tax=Pleuronectes platessa TaxID=8262 RepID=A0A9N7VBD7_PLEPL|nr:unnamed protein product [Pleuronectes platessa]